MKKIILLVDAVRQRRARADARPPRPRRNSPARWPTPARRRAPSPAGLNCRRAEDGSVQFTCRYEMQGADGRWASHEATLQQAEGQWVWIDGATRCDGQDNPELN